MSLPNPGMSYTPFDTLPASSLNDMVENIEALADGSGLDAGAIAANPTALVTDAVGPPFVEIGRSKLTVAGDTMTISSLPNKKYLKIFINALNTGGATDVWIRFNNDATGTYGQRTSDDFAAGVSLNSQNQIVVSASAAQHKTVDVFVVNNSAFGKLLSFRTAAFGGAGANAPSVRTGTGKWNNTSTVISRIDIINNGAGDFDIDSEFVVFGAE